MDYYFKIFTIITQFLKPTGKFTGFMRFVSDILLLSGFCDRYLSLNILLSGPNSSNMIGNGAYLTNFIQFIYLSYIVILNI